MKRILLYIIVVLLIGGLFDTSAPGVAAMTKKASPTQVQAQDWQQKWESRLSAAKNEGEVLLYLNAPSDTREALSDAFSKKYGLKVGVVLGSGQMLTSRLISEYQSGINQVDIFMPGATSILVANTHGIMARLEPMLILPEVRDPKNWFDGKLPYFDKEGMVLSYLSLTSPSIVYNSELVKDGEITSHLDLLKPQWKGQIVMYDPTISGKAHSSTYYLTQEWGGEEKIYEYLSAMIKRQGTMVTREMGQQVEWVARGKYKVALWPMIPPVIQFLKAGAHLSAASIKEKELITSGNGALGMTSKPAHPNAAIVFLNWFLSREGQAVAVKAMGTGSARIDVPAEGVHPIYIPKSGKKYDIENEESTLLKLKFQESVKKFFNELNK